MPVTRLALIVGTLILWVVPAQAVDLSNIDRTIAKEPAYQNKPKYCLLVFGPEAKTRVWLVLDGDVLYVDRNGNGDLREKGKRHTAIKHPDVMDWHIGDIRDPEDETIYKSLRVRQEKQTFCISVIVPARGIQVSRTDLNGNLAFAEDRASARIVHFGGALELSLEHKPSWHDGQSEFLSFSAIVGTPGLGPGTFACIAPDDMFKGAKFGCEATFAPKAAGAKPVHLPYGYDCY